MDLFTFLLFISTTAKEENTPVSTTATLWYFIVAKAKRNQPCQPARQRDTGKRQLKSLKKKKTKNVTRRRNGERYKMMK